ncbi:hypothetical protein WOLCODRAFT_145245 [Wolfiporia cocos MD-104 SS10]|uniref:Uncharacterized protein n=1 Tax=Wolfiporia cocos (strain MD-104) TaxID=742152 RepID=A0A2H3K784_WOLCO|nr:hypothetical protein WOLCODRAFT_145245 [Wolfiporia cocos MD-104 SS10]
MYFVAPDIDLTRLQKENMVGLVLSTIAYGVHVGLFLVIVRRFVRPSPFHTPRRWLLVYTFSLSALATTGIVLHAQWFWTVFSDVNYHSESRLLVLEETGQSPLGIIATIVYLMLNWMSDGLLLYRFWAICWRRWFAVVPSTAALFALVFLGSYYVKDIARISFNVWITVQTGPGIACIALSLAFNVIVPALIIGKLLLHRRKLMSDLGTRFGQVYMSLSTIFFESASLCTIVAVITFAALCANSPVQTALLPFLGQMQAIPPLLITVRVSEGYATSREASQLSRATIEKSSHNTTGSSNHPVKSGTITSEEVLDSVRNCSLRHSSYASTSTKRISLRLTIPESLDEYHEARATDDLESCIELATPQFPESPYLWVR